MFLELLCCSRRRNLCGFSNQFFTCFLVVMMLVCLKTYTFANVEHIPVICVAMCSDSTLFWVVSQRRSWLEGWTKQPSFRRQGGSAGKGKKRRKIASDGWSVHHDLKAACPKVKEHMTQGSSKRKLKESTAGMYAHYLGQFLDKLKTEVGFHVLDDAAFVIATLREF